MGAQASLLVLPRRICQPHSPVPAPPLPALDLTHAKRTRLYIEAFLNAPLRTETRVRGDVKAVQSSIRGR